MYRIEGHEFVKARNANHVALYLAGDVYEGHDREALALDVEALDVGASVTLHAIPWQSRVHMPREIVVRRVAA
jgi:hypothetical protein